MCTACSGWSCWQSSLRTSSGAFSTCGATCSSQSPTSLSLTNCRTHSATTRCSRRATFHSPRYQQSVMVTCRQSRIKRWSWAYSSSWVVSPSSLTLWALSLRSSPPSTRTLETRSILLNFTTGWPFWPASGRSPCQTRSTARSTNTTSTIGPAIG